MKCGSTGENNRDVRKGDTYRLPRLLNLLISYIERTVPDLVAMEDRISWLVLSVTSSYGESLSYTKGRSLVLYDICGFRLYSLIFKRNRQLSAMKVRICYAEMYWK
jgi:hypothetical protein